MDTRITSDGIEIVDLELQLSGWPEALAGLTIVQLSDLHFRNRVSGTLIRSGVALANDLHADIVVLTGDYVTNSTRYVAACAAELSKLRARHGVFAILGNHEVWTGVEYSAAQLATAGITTLRDASTRLDLAGTGLWLLGIEDTGYTGYNVPGFNSSATFKQRWQHKVRILHDLLEPLPESEPRILLVHNPDFVTMLPHERIDLVLSGHTHGGQVCLPWFGAPIVPSCFGNRHARGLIHGRNGSVCYVNKGVGLSPVHLRWNCRSEVTRFRLLPAPS